MRRFNGPYQHRANAWRIVEVDTVTGHRTTHHYKTEGDAQRAMAEFRLLLLKQSGQLVRQTIALYDTARRKKRKARTVDTTTYRLTAFFAPVMGKLLTTVTKADVTRCLERLEGQSDDSRLNIAAEVRTFLRWCLKAGHLKGDLTPLVVVEGKRKRGKNQPRLDEARSYLRVALELAASGDDAAVAAAMPLLMGVRASEVVNRTVRDLDDGGRLLWIPEAKTRAGIRRLVVPEVLRPHLLRLARGRGSQDKLFGDVTRYWLGYHVARLCTLARIPRFCPHGMRGAHSTFAVEAGTSSEAVARSLGHESFAVTAAHYATPEAVTNARQDRSLGELFPSSPRVPQPDPAERAA